MVLNMLLIQGISIVLGFDSGMTATYNLIVAGMVSLMVLMRVCNPMNKIRSILCNTMIVILWPVSFYSRICSASTVYSAGE